MAGRAYEQVFDASVPVVFSASVEAAARLGYTTREARPDAGVLSFNTGRSFSSWAGQDMTATMVAQGPYETKVILGGTLATRGSPFGGGGQVVSWGEKGRVAERFFAQLQACLEAKPTGQPPAGPSSARAPQADEVSKLERLAQLHAEGLLNDEEFAAAKARVLEFGQ